MPVSAPVSSKSRRPRDAPLPGMPLQEGDPGLFICKIADDMPPPPTTAAGAAAPIRPGIWLVLALCPACLYASGRYCRAHDMRPWW